MVFTLKVIYCISNTMAQEKKEEERRKSGGESKREGGGGVEEMLQDVTRPSRGLEC